MSEAKFTKGPWAVMFDSCGNPNVVKQRVADKGEKWVPSPYDANIVMAIGDHTDSETCDNQSANANLIAAAPEMYEAMQWFVDRVKRGEVRSTATYNKFKSILSKARGNQ